MKHLHEKQCGHSQRYTRCCGHIYLRKIESFRYTRTLSLTKGCPMNHAHWILLRNRYEPE
jgi:hypothetical protein